MRVIGEVTHPACKITLFAWNQKYLIKLEQGPCEQTFKVSEFDVASEADLRARLTPEFIDKALARFRAMHEDLALLI